MPDAQISLLFLLGVLADEMGLGKTILTTAFLAFLKKQNETNIPHLIIVPASVLANWERELNLICPQLGVVKYHGTLEEREQIKARLRKSINKKDSSYSDREPLDVVLTIFSYFSSEKCDDRSFLNKLKWNYVSKTFVSLFIPAVAQINLIVFISS